MGVAAGEVALALCLDAAVAVEGAGLDPAPRHGAFEDAPHRRDADGVAVLLALEFVVDAPLAAVRAGVADGQHAALVHEYSRSLLSH